MQFITWLACMYVICVWGRRQKVLNKIYKQMIYYDV